MAQQGSVITLGGSYLVQRRQRDDDDDWAISCFSGGLAWAFTDDPRGRPGRVIILNNIGERYVVDMCTRYTNTTGHWFVTYHDDDDDDDRLTTPSDDDDDDTRANLINHG